MACRVEFHPASRDFVRIEVGIDDRLLLPDRLVHIVAERVDDAASSCQRNIGKFGIFVRAVEAFRIHILGHIRICVEYVYMAFDRDVFDSVMPLLVVVRVRRQVERYASLVERDSCERHVVLPADKRSHPAPLRVGDREVISRIVSVSPDESLCSCRLDLSVLSNELSFRREDQVRAVKRAVNCVSFSDADAYISACFLRRGGKHLSLFARHYYRIVIIYFPVVAAGFVSLADRESERQSKRIARNERFREHYQLSAVLACFLY